MPDMGLLQPLALLSITDFGHIVNILNIICIQILDMLMELCYNVAKL